MKSEAAQTTTIPQSDGHEESASKELRDQRRKTGSIITVVGSALANLSDGYQQSLASSTNVVFSHVLGKPVNYQQIPFEAFEQQAGEEVTIMYRWFENVGYIADLAQLKRDFPALTNFESYLRSGDWAK